jgi:hypothetical protein
MAGETANIAEMARKQATELFEVFGWRQVGPTDQNWSCATKGHGKGQNVMHPTDSVYHYDDPYHTKRIYLNTDLKSYARDSITDGSIVSALTSLSKATECANKSEGWQKLYAPDGKNYRVIGLLYIFNHDGEYDKDFSSRILDIRSPRIGLRKGYRVVALGPPDLVYLSSVAQDILAQITREGLPPMAKIRFYYPELIQRRTQLNLARAATIEVLTAPWQVFHYATSSGGEGPGGYYLYYRGAGETLDEFKYIIDYIFRYQLLREAPSVQIRVPFASNDAASNFGKAKESYAQDFYGFEEYGKEEFAKRLEQISFQSIAFVSTKYSGIEIGMERAHGKV